VCSLTKALKKIGTEVIVSNQRGDIENAGKLILLGVGSFAEGMKNLNEKGLVEVITKEVIEKKKPLLGICLGAQLLFENSEEAPGVRGLGLILGEVKKFNLDSNLGLKVPHMGWNSIYYDLKSKSNSEGNSDNDNSDDNKEVKNAIEIFNNIGDGTNFYFVHSFHFVPTEEIDVLWTNYGYPFVSAFKKNNIFGTQFHPEKSQKEGLHLLKNFANL